MPAVGGSGGGGAGKRRKGRREERGGGFWGAVKRLPGDFARDAEEIVTGMPTGLNMAWQAIDQALPKSPILKDEGPHNDPRMLKMLGREMAQGFKEDIRHPLRNPASTTLTLLGLASLGGGAAARGTAGLKAASKGGVKAGVKAAKAKPKYTRKFHGRPATKTSSGKVYEVNASPNPLVRGARKVTLDQAYKRSQKRGIKASEKKGKELGLTQKQLDAKKAELKLRQERASFRKANIEAKKAATKPRTTTYRAKMTPAQAEARIAELEKAVGKRVDTVFKALWADPSAKISGGKVNKMPRRSQAPGHARSDVGGGVPIDKQFKPGQRQTSREATRARAEKELYRLGKKEGAHPTLAKIAAQMDELEELKKVHTERQMPAAMRDPNAPIPDYPKTLKSRTLKPKPYKEPSRQGVYRAEGEAKAARGAVKSTKAEMENTRQGRYARAIERRENDKRTRYIKQSKGEVLDVDKPVQDMNVAREIWTAPSNAMRLTMMARPRYIAQNIAGTAGMMASRFGGNVVKHAKDVAKIRKADPETYAWASRTMGESGASSIATGAVGPLSGAAHWAAARANLPENTMRITALKAIAEENGVTLAQLRKMNPESNKWQRIVAEANDVVVDYSRIGGNSRAGQWESSFARSGIPIFYPMTKGFTRYAGRYPLEHSAQSAALAQVGKVGSEEQLEQFGGPLPPWSPYLIPTSEGMTKNPQNIMPFSPGMDIARQLAQATRKGTNWPTLSLAQNVSPSVELAYGAITGRGFATGFPLEGVEDTSKAEAALREQMPQMTPGYDLAAMLGMAEAQTGKAYESPSREDLFRMWALGPALHERRTKYDVLRQQGRGKGAKKKKKKAAGW